MTVGEVLPMRMTCHQALDGESRMLPDADHHARNLHTHRPLALLRQLYARSIAASGNRKGLVCLRTPVITSRVWVANWVVAGKVINEIGMFSQLPTGFLIRANAGTAESPKHLSDGKHLRTGALTDPASVGW